MTILGFNSDGTAQQSGNQDRIYLTQHTVTGGNQDVSLLHAKIAQTGLFRLVIYDSTGAGGSPGALVCKTANLSGPGVGTFVDVSGAPTTPTTLYDGQSYWLGMHWGDNVAQLYVISGAGSKTLRYATGVSFASGTPTTYPASATVANYELSVWADIGPAIPTAPKAIRIKAASGWVDLSQGVAKDPIFDAKGDLVVGSAADVGVRLPVGATGQILTANPTVASGISWETLASASGGLTVSNGTPSNSLGEVGDVYLDRLTGILYEKQPVYGSEVTVGSTSRTGVSATGQSLNELYVAKYTLSGVAAGATFTKIRCRISGGGTPGLIKLILYGNAAGVPGALIDSAETTILAGAAETVVELPLTGNKPAANGDYFLGFHNGTFSGAQVWMSTSGGTIWYKSGMTYPTLPDPFANSGTAAFIVRVEAVAQSTTYEWVKVSGAELQWEDV